MRSMEWRDRRAGDRSIDAREKAGRSIRFVSIDARIGVFAWNGATANDSERTARARTGGLTTTTRGARIAEFDLSFLANESSSTDLDV